MAVPTQLPTTAQNETFGGVSYHKKGRSEIPRMNNLIWTSASRSGRKAMSTAERA